MSTETASVLTRARPSVTVSSKVNRVVDSTSGMVNDELALSAPESNIGVPSV
ncbi:hypothetical protein [Haloarcula amylovorans]|uniref:hypothetical protein n=1 Tax=Haloarcula amylovorans TaxID=2562280 RepID=UPI0014307015|nr:hypothetical protein [Halomicroarcula amylolytica]